MTDQVNQDGAQGQPQETPEQRDARLAELYRAQLDGGVQPDNAKNEGGDEKPQRPEHIPEKFWDAEKGEIRVDELAKSYAELEKKNAKPAADEGEGQGDGEGEPDEAAKAAAAEFAKYREGVTEKIMAGTALTDADYAPAEKMGLSREDVDTFIAGLKAIGQLHAAEVHKEAGGEEHYRAMIDWAKENYTPAEIAAYDRDVYSTDTAVSLNAVRGLAARYQLANGRSGKNVVKGGAGSTKGDGYRSKNEMVTDMRDPRYSKDPAFRAEVARKIAGAKAAGVDLTQ